MVFQIKNTHKNCKVLFREYSEQVGIYCRDLSKGQKIANESLPEALRLEGGKKRLTCREFLLEFL